MYSPSRNLGRAAGVAVAALAIFGARAWSQGEPPPLGEDQRIVPVDGTLSDNFGASVSVSGSAVLLGAMFGDGQGGPSDSGSAYVYRRSLGAWTLERELLASDATTGMRFGSAAAIDGDAAVVGAYLDDAAGFDSGSAYVYLRDASGWFQAAKLVAPDGSPGDWFGRAVAISGDTLVVGADNDDDLGNDSGSVYVYFRGGAAYVLQAKLTASDGGPADSFGAAVAIDGDTLVVGAPLAPGGATSSGAAYVFRRQGTTWHEEAKLVHGDALAFDELGAAVAVDGERVVLGAPAHGANDPGAAYVYERRAKLWSQVAKLESSTPSGGDRFGQAVAVDGDVATAGVPFESAKVSDAGAVHVFVRCGASWIDDGLRVSADAQFGDRLGAQLGLDAGVLVGSSTAHDLVGAAYLFVHASAHATSFCYGDGLGSACPCANESPVGGREGCRNSTGSGAALAAGGSPRASRDSLRMHASQLVPGQPALLFSADNAIAGGEGVPFGDGLRCIGGALQRLGVVAGGPDGVASWNAGTGASPGWSPGEVRRFQVWYRDPAAGPCGSTFNTTSAIAIELQP